MEPMRRENRVLKGAVALLFCALLLDVVMKGEQTQRVPGPGTGIVDVHVVKQADVAAAQRGEWRVAQQGDWRVGVQGTVATLPAAPPFIRVGGVYSVRGPSLEMLATIRELHPSGWARVSDELKQEHWINLTVLSSVQVR